MITKPTPLTRCISSNDNEHLYETVMVIIGSDLVPRPFLSLQRRLPGLLLVGSPF
jgi:hypothetical protein